MIDTIQKYRKAHIHFLLEYAKKVLTGFLDLQATLGDFLLSTFLMPCPQKVQGVYLSDLPGIHGQTGKGPVYMQSGHRVPRNNLGSSAG